MIAPGFVGTKSDIDRNAGGAQPGMALPCDFWIGIFNSRHHARDTGGNRGIGARRLTGRPARECRACESKSPPPGRPAPQAVAITAVGMLGGRIVPLFQS